MNYEEELKAIAEAQKRQKKSELDIIKQQDLQAVDTQQNQLMPTFQQQKNQANVQSELRAKNFGEFLARRGQARAGISAVGEMSRLNTLGNTISGINTQETQALQNFANQRNQIQNAYTGNLTSAYNAIDTNLANNLYNEKQRQDEMAQRVAQQQFENQMALRNYNLSASKAYQSQNQPQNYKNVTLAYQPGVIVQSIQSGNKIVHNLADGSTLTLDKGVNPFTGKVSKNAYITDPLSGKKTLSVFSNGYQPKQIKNEPVKKFDTVTFNNQQQSVWKYGSNYAIFDGTIGEYRPARQVNGVWQVDTSRTL
jgi:hypothetical protein